MENITRTKGKSQATENRVYEIWIKERNEGKQSNSTPFRIKKVIVTKEQFDEYYGPVNSFRRRMQRHGRCACPKKMRLMCDMDCANCPYQMLGDEVSLNETVMDEEGNEEEIINLLPSEDDMPEEVLLKKELYNEIHRCINELPEYQRKIIEFFMEGKSEDEIGQLLSRDSTSIHFQKIRIFKILREKLKNFLD